MTATNNTRRRRLISVFCFLALGLFFLTDPVTRLSVRGDRPASIVQIALTGFVAPLHVDRPTRRNHAEAERGEARGESWPRFD